MHSSMEPFLREEGGREREEGREREGGRGREGGREGGREER